MADVLSDISHIDTKNPKPITICGQSRLARFVIGLGISSAIGFSGWRRGSLSGTGLVGAIVTGTVVTVAGGYGHAAQLVGFFATSSSLSRLPGRNRVNLAGYADKGDRRDLKQVLANGGVSTMITLLATKTESNHAYTGSLAAATGDTWATEFGSRYGGQPRHILTLRPVPTGFSGGVTSMGLLASAAGGAFMGGLAILSTRLDPSARISPQRLLLTGVVSGVVGSLSDSLIGATLQERRYCDRCRQPTERFQHTCGYPTRIVGGIPGLTNDGVNLLGTLVGAITGWMNGAWGRGR